MSLIRPDLKSVLWLIAGVVVVPIVLPKIKSVIGR